MEVDRATMGPEHLAAKLTAYARLHGYVPTVPGRRPTVQEPALEDWRRRYPLFPRLLFVLDGTGPTGAKDAYPCPAFSFLHDVPVLAAPLTDLLRDGPSAPVWRPVQDPAQQVAWHTWP
ncbi:hypothetical protein OHA74_53150 [Streptomyces phaeochromogenes]|uniref:hypothetical protein n=1 Tax=Streptomyces phaeochromogenes TaxID=1923 RepID=UPI002E2E51EF|nr:hypothetical protein [Streptomyces phaeochromogenes]